MTPPLERCSKHINQQFDAFAVTMIREMPVKRDGQILGETDSRICRMLFANVKTTHAQLSFGNAGWVGGGAMNRRNGLNYLTVFGDLMTKRVLFAIRCLGALVWAAFAQQLMRHHDH